MTDTSEEGQALDRPNAGSTFHAGGLVLLIAFAVVANFWGIDTGPVLGDHEAIVAQNARQIRETGDWLIPYFNDEAWIRKPPLQPWLVAAASYVVDPPDLSPPVSPMASRFPSALAAVIASLVVYGLGRSMFTPRIGLIAGGIMACCGATLFYGHNAQTEMVMACLTAASLACFYVGTRWDNPRFVYLLASGALLGLAMLAKAPLPLALAGLTVAAWWLLVLPIAWVVKGRERVETPQPGTGSTPAHAAPTTMSRLLTLVLGCTAAIVALAVVFVPWPVYVYLNVENALDLWEAEFLNRYTGELSDDVQPFWYYIPLIFALTVPFCLSIPESFAAPFMRFYRAHRRGLLFAFTWAVVQIAFLSTSSFKRPHYMLPAVPALCLLLAPVIDRFFFALEWDRKLMRLGGAALTAAAAIGMPIALAVLHRNEPEFLWTMWIPALVVVTAIIAATWLYYYNQRVASLALVYAMPVIAFAAGWSALGRSDFDREEVLFAEKLKALDLGDDASVTWAIGRTNARVSYYGETRITQLFTAAEMAARRSNRIEIPPEILQEGAEKIVELLERDRPEYIIIDLARLGKLGAHWIAALQDLDHHEVFRVYTHPTRMDKVLMLITNGWNTGAGQTVFRPTTAPAVDGSAGVARERGR